MEAFQIIAISALLFSILFVAITMLFVKRARARNMEKGEIISKMNARSEMKEEKIMLQRELLSFYRDRDSERNFN